jgi:hypothetical protein
MTAITLDDVRQANTLLIVTVTPESCEEALERALAQIELSPEDFTVADDRWGWRTLTVARKEGLRARSNGRAHCVALVDTSTGRLLHTVDLPFTNVCEGTEINVAAFNIDHYVGRAGSKGDEA